MNNFSIGAFRRNNTTGDYDFKPLYGDATRLVFFHAIKQSRRGDGSIGNFSILEKSEIQVVMQRLVQVVEGNITAMQQQEILRLHNIMAQASILFNDGWTIAVLD